MAELLSNSFPATPTGTRFWAVDKILLTYLAFTTILILGWWSRVEDAGMLFAAHVVGVALVVFEVKRPNRTTWIFRNWYALPFVASCYKEMALLIPAVRQTDADQWLADLDFRLWSVHPTVWLERVQTPALTEFLQIVYTLFVPAVLLIPLLIWRKRRPEEFQYYAFLIALGYLASYVGYLIVPARGPRFLLRNLQHVPLQGMWLFQIMQSTLDRLESAHYDCFPSGHTELTIIAWWASRAISKRLFRVYFTYTPLIIFATVYLRYHYTVDVMAGILLAAILIWSAPALYRKLSREA
ncbi:MAG: phosphatase PAP2 family protein [Acidobacteriia bacterium]|nr:phosphatase PAP2 family protein [Terriglobia bacterium]